MSKLPKVLADIEEASNEEHPDPLTTPYDTLQNYPNANSGETYITDSSSDLVSTASSCCSPTDDQEVIPPPLPPPRQPTPSLENDKPSNFVNGSVKEFERNLFDNQKSNSLPTSSSVSPMVGRSRVEHTKYPKKNYTKTPVHQSRSSSELLSPQSDQTFSDLYKDQSTSLDEAISSM